MQLYIMQASLAEVIYIVIPNNGKQADDLQSRVPRAKQNIVRMNAVVFHIMHLSHFDLSQVGLW